MFIDSKVEQDLQPQQDPLKTRPALDGTQRHSSTTTVDILEPESNDNKAIPWAEQLQHDLDDVVRRKRRSTNVTDTRLASRVKSDGRPPITIGSSSNGTFPRSSKAPPPRSDSIVSNLSIAIESHQTNALPPLPPILTSTASPKPSSLPTTVGGVKPRPISPAMQFHSLRSQPLSPRPPQKRNSRPLSRQSIQGKENSGPLSELFRQSTISLSFSVRDSLQSKVHANSWFLGNDYHDDEAVFNENNQLTGATLGAYIELLTPHRTAAGIFISIVCWLITIFTLLLTTVFFFCLWYLNIARCFARLDLFHYLPSVQYSKRSRLLVDSKVQPEAPCRTGCAPEQAVDPKEARSNPSEVGALFLSMLGVDILLIILTQNVIDGQCVYGLKDLDRQLLGGRERQ